MKILGESEAVTMDDVKTFVKESLAPAIQNWVVEEFAPEVQNWVVEEYTPMIDNWVTEQFKPELEESIRESINDNVSENKTEKLNTIDSILGILESRKDSKPAAPVTEKTEDKYAKEYIVEHMPDEMKPHWNLASDIVKESLVSKSRLYDFTNEGALAAFWEKADFTEPQAQINEGKQKTITFGGENLVRESLRAMGRKLGYRD